MPNLRVPPHLESLDLELWVDPVVDTLGHDPRSAYVERFWLATLGPSTVWLLRHLADRLDREGPCTIGLDETAAALGLTRAPARRSAQLLRSIDRSATFGTTRFDGVRTLYVRRRLPPLSRRQLSRLPASLAEEHARWMQREVVEPTQRRMLRRAQRLALTLLELGESYDDTEQMLHRWRFHPAIAHDAMRWASAQRTSGDGVGTSGPVPSDRAPSGPSSSGPSSSTSSSSDAMASS